MRHAVQLAEQPVSGREADYVSEVLLNELGQPRSLWHYQTAVESFDQLTIHYLVEP